MKPTERFSNRVADYAKHRPHYPVQVFETLKALTPTHPSIADVGSGTGIFTRPLLEFAGVVYGVEPNLEMREAGERYLAQFANFISINGTAEDTGLQSESVELVTCAQAFHWFEREQTREEFRRILKPHGQVALVWNERSLDATPFLAAYELLLRESAVDYIAVSHKTVSTTAQMDEFYGSGDFQTFRFAQRQSFDWEGLRGRSRSSSYVPSPDDPRYPVFEDRLQSIYEKYQQEGQVEVVYDTSLTLGRLS